MWVISGSVVYTHPATLSHQTQTSLRKILALSCHLFSLLFLPTPEQYYANQGNQLGKT